MKLKICHLSSLVADQDEFDAKVIPQQHQELHDVGVLVDEMIMPYDMMCIHEWVI